MIGALNPRIHYHLQFVATMFASLTGYIPAWLLWVSLAVVVVASVCATLVWRQRNKPFQPVAVGIGDEDCIKKVHSSTLSDTPLALWWWADVVM